MRRRKVDQLAKMGCLEEMGEKEKQDGKAEGSKG